MPCLNVTEVCNEWAQLGLEKPKKLNRGLVPTDPVAFVAEYSALVARDMKQKDIAKYWGVSESQIRTKVTHARQLGLAVPCRTKSGYTSPVRPQGIDQAGVTVPMLGRPHNEHGGGRWGIKRCNAGPDGGKCQPCIDRCQQSRLEARQNEYARRKAQRRQDRNSR